MNDSPNPFLGKQLKFPIYNFKNGSLLLPAGTILEEKHMKILEQHHIFLDLDSVEDDSAEEKQESSIDTGALINEATNQLKDIFNDVKFSNHIPIHDIESAIAPSIHKAIETPYLSNLLVELEVNDEYTYRHNIGVGAIATLIGKWMNLSELDLSILTMSAILHDVGKTKIPLEILNKPGKLTKEEFTLIKKHTTYGFNLIRNTSEDYVRLANVALLHHEREDGLGYPLGVKGSRVDLLSKIVAVADVFHAMTSKRPYHDAKPFYEVVKEMHRDTFGKLDPKITSLFLRKVMSMLTGEYVQLTNGKMAQIVMINQSDPFKPFVKVGNEFIDLSKESTLEIHKVIKAPVLI